MATPRSYRMGARAASTSETRGRILSAALSLCTQRMTIEITLDDVAERAGTSVQTVLRHFGSRAGLLDATVAFGTTVIVAEREAPPGDPPTAVRIIVDHYELRGDFVIRLLAQEDDPRIAGIVASGRAEHREWIRGVFPGRAEQDVDLLVAATDVYVWKLLRRDRGLDRAATEAGMLRLVRAVLTDRAGEES